jgi:FAD/FMN-containing dehydrogenase
MGTNVNVDDRYRITTTADERGDCDETELQALAGSPPDFIGELLVPGDEQYQSAATILNQPVQGQPAVIVRCAGVGDVRAALALAREEGLEISVRGGGHSIAGWATNDGGLVIDLSRMRWVKVDPRTSTAWIGGGTVASAVVLEASQYGLAAVTGTNPGPGVTNLVMGVGEGYLSPRHGFGADHVLALEVVTANGEVIEVSAEEHPDLYWAMRGAGANFGVVTALQLRLHPIPEECTGGYLEFSPDDALAVSRHVFTIMENGSEYFFPFLTLGRGEERGSPRVLLWVGHTGPRDLAERELGELRAIAEPVVDTSRRMSYVELVHQERISSPYRQAWEVCRFGFDGQAERQVEILLAQVEVLPPDTGLMLWRTVPKPVDPPSACPRLAGITVFMASAWQHEQEDAERAKRLEDVAAAFAATGAVSEAGNTVNHVTNLDRDRAERLYGADTYARLQRLKATYDPDNVFRRNHNIPPATIES